MIDVISARGIPIHISAPQAGLKLPESSAALPTLSPFVDRLGPWGFIINEAKHHIRLRSDGADTGASALVLFNHPYADGAEQETTYFWDNETGPTTTILSIEKSAGASFLRTIGHRLRVLGFSPDVSEAKVGMNTNSYNRLLGSFDHDSTTRFQQDPTRQRLAQSVPATHIQAMVYPKDFFQNLPDMNLDPRAEQNHLELLRAKFRKEMGIPESLLTPSFVTDLTRELIYDRLSFERWRRAFEGSEIKQPWRTPEENGLMPFGLEFTLGKTDIATVLEEPFMSHRIWEIMSGIERHLSRSPIFNEPYDPNDPYQQWRIPGYNFGLTFLQENGRVKMVFSPTSLRAGFIEQGGTFVVRTKRNGST